MKRIAFDTVNHNKYYFFNEEYIVCLGFSSNRVCISVMDNNRKILDRTWSDSDSLNMEKIEKIASQMLYNLGCNGEIKEYELPEGLECIYMIDSNNIQFPMIISYYPNGSYIPLKEKINCHDEYLEAMKRHKENGETINSVGSLSLWDTLLNIRSINESIEVASSQLEYMSNVLNELFYSLDKGFKNDFVNQLKESYELNLYLQHKVHELKRKLPQDLYLAYLEDSDLNLWRQGKSY
ncbi:hypothetical protein [Anaerocolumna aminovalerica]|uniref:hypothetical protein n=1 Tax=Anaerocolumna aminovalerica TaxID=1527 RepID=UPI000BE2616C|nr:hypothetical protein [Anaerocolumna aminovalerica]